MPRPCLINALLQPEIYPDSPSSVRLVETHISWVLLTGKFAYKIKKPVRFPFLDFSGLSLRRHYCEEELRLNRRLAPQLYLEVVAIRGTPERPVFVGTGPAIEYALKMREFDRGAEFDHLALHGRLTPVHIDRLADKVANFHLATPKLAGPNAAGKSERVQEEALNNFSEIAPIARPDASASTLERLREWTVGEYAKRREFMQNRAETGFIRECHGDLHLSNIVVLDGQSVPFDCIEFNRDMRWIDVIDELAFVVMDLCAHRLPAFGYRLINRYLQITGDYPALALLDYYRVYRAIVRAKVALLTRDLPGLERKAGPAFDAEYLNYLSVALACTAKTSALLIITHGLSGSGKSTLAAKIAEHLPAIQLRSDVERKRLALTEPRFGQALYSEEATQMTYLHLSATAASLLESGFSVIVDATFLKQSWRNHFRLLAGKAGVGFRILDFQAPQAVLRDRIEKRLAEQCDPSDADLAVLESQIKHQEPLTDSEREDSLSVSTDRDGDVGALIERILYPRRRKPGSPE